MKLMLALNPSLVEGSADGRSPISFLDILKEKFLQFDPLLLRVANWITKIFTSLMCCCLKKNDKDNNFIQLPQASTSSTSGMLTLSIHLNHLLTWVTSVFSISIAANLTTLRWTNYVFLVVVASNAALSCLSGFWISGYLIKTLEESLSSQILTVFSEQ